MREGSIISMREAVFCAHEGGGYFVLSKRTSKNLGCYDSWKHAIIFACDIMTTYIVPRTFLGYYESLKHAIIYACDIRRQ